MIIPDWINKENTLDLQGLGLSKLKTSQNPDEIAYSLVASAGQLLRSAADRRADRHDVARVLANLSEGKTEAELPNREQVAPQVFEGDAANRYLRILTQCAINCLNLNGEGGTAKLEREAGTRQDLIDTPTAILSGASEEALKYTTPFGVLEAMLARAIADAQERGITPFQIMSALLQAAQAGILNENRPLVPRYQEGSTPVPNIAFSHEEWRSNKANIRGTQKFLKAVKWDAKASEPDEQKSICPLVAYSKMQGVDVPILAIGYSSSDQSEFAVKCREICSYEFNLRNLDVLALSAEAEKVEVDGRVYTVVGEIFMRADGEAERIWRPAVVWPGCTSVEVLLDRVAAGDSLLKDPACADPEQAVMKLYNESFASGKGKRG